jgi:hypothetical protein
MQFMKLLKKFDLFAPGLSLNFKGEETFKTNLGGLLGILCLAPSLLYFYYKGEGLV